jgi:hypothetical protein
LMHSKQISADRALGLIMWLRPESLPNPGFYLQLKEFEKERGLTDN